MPQENLPSSVFRTAGLPSFDNLFKQIVVLKYFWSSAYRHKNTKPVPLRHVPRYLKPRVRIHYGKATRRYYVPAILNELLDDVFSLTTRKTLRVAVQALENI